jgi:hypothetical protein
MVNCNRAIRRIYRVDDVSSRESGDVITMAVPQAGLAKFEKRYGDWASLSARVLTRSCRKGTGSGQPPRRRRVAAGAARGARVGGPVSGWLPLARGAAACAEHDRPCCRHRCPFSRGRQVSG